MKLEKRLGILLIVMWVLGSALGVVYAKHESRKLFVELEALKTSRDNLNIEWGKLQLEQSTWATPNRIESIAHSELGMQVPSPDKVVIVTP
jgi:cell division protein FtsL